MNDLTLIKSEKFGNIECDFYKNNNDDILMTREQIGRSLEYTSPQKAIDRLYSRHKERLNQFSMIYKIKSTDGKYYNTTLYSKDGIIEICKLSSASNLAKETLLSRIGCTDKEKELIISQNNSLYKQGNTKDILTKTFKNICPIETQVVISGYRVDFVINKNVIVECDELNHIYRDKKYEAKREKYLTGKGYKLIRFNPDNDDIFEFLNKILKSIM